MRHHATLRYVDAIARHGSIRRAAEALAITASALNRRLLALEEEIGAPLFERRARGVRLSAAGELFVHHARRQMADMERVQASIEDMKGARRGHVAVALDASVDPEPLMGVIDRHRREHPGVTFAVLSCDRGTVAAMLEDYRADLALAIEPEHAGSFATLSTLPLRAEVLMSRSHPLAGASGLRLHDLLAHPLVLPPPGRSLRFLADLGAARAGLALDPVVVSDGVAARTLVRSGAALGMRVGSAGVERGDYDSQLAVPLDPRDMPPAMLHLGHLRDRSLPVPAARFAEVIRRRIDELSP